MIKTRNEKNRIVTGKLIKQNQEKGKLIFTVSLIYRMPKNFFIDILDILSSYVTQKYKR